MLFEKGSNVILVYTIITGGHDTLKIQPVSDAPMVCMMNGIPYENSDPRRVARYAKVMSHVMAPEVVYTLWVDGSIQLKPIAVKYMIEKYLSDCDMAALKHPGRNTVAEEGAAILRDKKDAPNTVLAQLRRYGDMVDTPRVCQTGILLRRHSEKVKRFNELWWHEIETGSVRDQLSFPIAAKAAGVSYAMIEDRSFFEIQEHCAPSKRQSRRRDRYNFLRRYGI